MIKNEDGLFSVLSNILESNPDTPFTCVGLYDYPEVRKVAKSPNRVSDYLGNMWRKGDLLRFSAPRTANSSARWMYQWNRRSVILPPPTENKKFEYAKSAGGGASILSRPTIEITDNGGEITIDLPKLTIIIRPKADG